ncbi:MAG: hypothetical protein AAFX39_16495 [Pseudomonadota bacterium]
MRLNWNDPHAFTAETVSALIGSVDDCASRQIRVSDDGMVYVADVDDAGLVRVGPPYRATGALTEPQECLTGVRAFLDVWKAGEGFFGVDAAADSLWVETVYRQLTMARDRNVRGFIDMYEELETDEHRP